MPEPRIVHALYHRTDKKRECSLVFLNYFKQNNIHSWIYFTLQATLLQVLEYHVTWLEEIGFSHHQVKWIKIGSPIPCFVPVTSIEANPLLLRFRVLLTVRNPKLAWASKLFQKRTDSKRHKDKSLSFIKRNLERIFFILIDFFIKSKFQQA